MGAWLSWWCPPPTPDAGEKCHVVREEDAGRARNIETRGTDIDSPRCGHYWLLTETAKKIGRTFQ